MPLFSKIKTVKRLAFEKIGGAFYFILFYYFIYFLLKNGAEFPLF